MMMRSIRENTKWIMLVLALAFAAWLVFDWVQSRDTAAATGVNPVVAVVNGQEIRYSQWSAVLDAALQRARGRAGGASLTDEERRRVEQEAWDQLIEDVLLEQEIERLGIEVTDSEIRQAFRVSPPPELRDHPAFQTEGTFDYAKYQEFFADPGVDENLLLQIEAYYRGVLPRARLSQQLSEGVWVSDGELWRAYRDRNETVSATWLSVDPRRLVPDAQITVSDEEIRARYRERRDEYRRPATATVHLVSFPLAPTREDSARALARADSIRAAVQAGEIGFDEAAERWSADSATAGPGGEMGRVARGQLLPALDEVAFEAPQGQVSEPVASGAGYHLLLPEDRGADSVTVSQILVPIRLSEESEDRYFERLDRFEGIALTEGLLAAADSLGLSAQTGVTLTEGFDFVPGAGSLGVAVDWAFDPAIPPGELSEFFENASGYHIVELVSRAEEQVVPLDEVRDEIEQSLRAERRRMLARERVAAELDRIRAAASLEAAGEELGWPVAEAGPFTRTEFVQGLGRGTEAVGAAFGAEVGEIVGPVDAGGPLVVLRVDERTPADPAAFPVVKEALRSQLLFQRQQANVTRWLEGLRETAEVVDRRDRLNAASQETAGLL